MPRITLPDGEIREFDHPVSAAEVAEAVSPSVARHAVGARINGELRDLNTTIDHDADVRLITASPGEKESDPDALYLMRHSCAHVMAEAIQRLVPGVLLVYGPPLDNGFYYDMYVPDKRPLSSEDFKAIEEEMGRIIAADKPFTRYEMPNDEGMAKLKEEGSKYKLDNAERAIEAGSDELSWYATGEPGRDWEDLCRGPHVPSTGRIGAWKVTSLASSYWHGDADSDRLTRVYGTAFTDRKQLKRYLKQLEEAKERDHRVLNRQLKLFHIDEAVGQGLVLWTPNGSYVRQELQNFMNEELRKQGYHQIFTPHIGKLSLYRTSGHFPYYQKDQYPPLIQPQELQRMAKAGLSCADLANEMKEGELDGYLLKPMNCPHHIKIYSSEQHSYRDLPIRLAEYGVVYRWEQSGEVGGMTRVRSFAQDDAHIFCTEDQVQQEVLSCLELVKILFDTLNMKDFRVRIGLRDPDSSKYVGETSSWDRAEQACREAARIFGVPFTEEAGEAAFYGPKIDIILRDVLGREWQTGTVQVDYNLRERFDLTYIGPDNQPHRPVMIHRTIFGSMERFVGILIEHFAGAFPTWLAPEQARVLPVSEKSLDYGYEVRNRLFKAGVRVGIDASDERLPAKIKAATMMKIPYLLVVGPRDAEQRAVSVRARGIRHDLGALGVEAFESAILREIATRGRETVTAEHFSKATARAG
jgi:threonyl-tRNA synthetase